MNLGKRKDVFEFHVESVGIYPPEEIVRRAIAKLREKSEKWIDVLVDKDQNMNSD